MPVAIKPILRKEDRPHYGATPLLTYLAGEHAGPIAAVWPAPHEAFLALPAARRHAAAIVLASGLAQREPAHSIRHLIERQRDSVLAQAILPNGETAGLIKAMRKMGEGLWQTEEYARFLTLFLEPNANRALRHLNQLRPSHLWPIVELPAPLREAKILRFVEQRNAAYDLGLAYQLAVAMRDTGHDRKLVERWQRAENRYRLYQMAAEDLTPDRFLPASGPPKLPAAYAQITTRADLEATALRFQNCLRDFVSEIAVGRMAVYTRDGNPTVAMALTRDAAGWRLAEAEGRANEELPTEVLQDIVADLAVLGVRTGPPIKVLIYRLADHGRNEGGDRGPHANWQDRLELGELWD
ncbi:MAG: hypothetical protein AAFO68_01560 [Pseudomonadota bacterium]